MQCRCRGPLICHSRLVCGRQLSQYQSFAVYAFKRQQLRCNFVHTETFCTVRECEVVDSRVNLEMSAHVKLTCCSPGTHVEEAIQWVLGSIQDSQSSSAKSKDYSLPFYKVRLLSSIRSFQLSRNIVIKHTCPYTSSVYYFYDIWKLLKHNNAKLSYMIGHALDGGQFLARCGLRTTCQLLLRLSKQWPL